MYGIYVYMSMGVHEGHKKPLELTGCCELPVWVLGTEFQSSVKAVHALNQRAPPQSHNQLLTTPVY